MSPLRLLLPRPAAVGDLEAGREDTIMALADLYAYPDPVPARGWVRANMVASVDGAATGADGRSGSVSGRADRSVFSALRGVADVVLVGAGTVRAEGYRSPSPKPAFAQRRAAAHQSPAPALAVVSRSGQLDDASLFTGANPSLLVTSSAADVEGLCERLGGERVIVAGDDRVDLVAAVAALAHRGLRRVLLEGGPSLLGTALSAGCVDELCLTWSPVLVGGTHPRIAESQPGSWRLRLAHLLEHEGTLLGRWLVDH